MLEEGWFKDIMGKIGGGIGGAVKYVG